MGLDKVDKDSRRLWQTALRAVRPFPLTSSKIKLLVGVSGGTDSLALLHLLWQQLGASQLIAAHLNHNLRAGADEDAKFVAETAAAWQIPFVGQKVDVAQVAKIEGLSLEAAGRQIRYQFLAEQAIKLNVAAVVVAHHADDQAETILLHILRGSGSAGLQGMQAVGKLPGKEELVLLRPFLPITRAEIEAYCQKQALSPRHDASNEDIRFARNRIRQELLPLLETYNPQIVSRLRQLAVITADEQQVQQAQFRSVWLEIVALQHADFVMLHRAGFVDLPVAWQRLALRQVVQQLRPFHTEISFRTIEQARLLAVNNQSGTAATLPGGLVMQVEVQMLHFGKSGEGYRFAEPQLLSEQPLSLAIPGEVVLAGDWRLTAVVRPDISLDEARLNKDRWQAFVSLAADDTLWVRPYWSGERFQPLGLQGHSQSIQDLLSNRKVPRGKRPLWPIVVTDDHPAWIVGQHLDERFRVTSQSSRIIQLCCKSAAEEKSTEPG